jgi:amidase
MQMTEASESRMTAPGLWADSLVSTGERIARGEISSRELTEAMLERVERYDARLKSYAAVAPETALRAAAQADEDILAGRRRGPLHGVPLAVKDAFYTLDIKTGLGSSIYDDWRPPFESTATRRLCEGGAVLLGKLKLTEGVYADHHPTIEPPINPFNADHWTGTSSSGSGVAVTAGLCYGSLATDTGGSIRLPSSCCGVVGMKPTWGRVSRNGVFPLAESLDHVGAMARTAADAAALLGSIAGPDPADATAAPYPVPDYLAEIEGGLKGVTIGVDRGLLRERASDEVRTSIDAVEAAASRLGARFVDVVFPPIEPILRGWAVQCAVEAAFAHRDAYPSRQAEYGPRLASLLDRGRSFAGLDLCAALKDRREFNGRVALMFEEIDLLLVPGLPVAGPSLEYVASLGEDPAAILAIGPFTAPFDVCGYPTITFPCGVTSAGVPIGCQFAGKPFAESLLFRAAHAYQGATEWHRRRPEM